MAQFVIVRLLLKLFLVLLLIVVVIGVYRVFTRRDKPR